MIMLLIVIFVARLSVIIIIVTVSSDVYLNMKRYEIAKNALLKLYLQATHINFKFY